MMPAAGPVGADEETTRLFIALTLPEPVRDILRGLPQAVSGVSWSPAAQWHVTLRFLGDVSATRNEDLVARLATVRVEPFVLPIEGVGTFPPNRPPRVVWVGTGNGHPRLFQLRQRVDDAVLAAGIDLDVRTFHPHITLARCNEQVGAGLNQWLHDHREFTAPPFRVAAFDLVRSALRRTGAVHTLVRRFPLHRAP